MDALALSRKRIARQPKMTIQAVESDLESIIAVRVRSTKSRFAKLL